MIGRRGEESFTNIHHGKHSRFRFLRQNCLQGSVVFRCGSLGLDLDGFLPAKGWWQVKKPAMDTDDDLIFETVERFGHLEMTSAALKWHWSGGLRPRGGIQNLKSWSTCRETRCRLWQLRFAPGRCCKIRPNYAYRRELLLKYSNLPLPDGNPGVLGAAEGSVCRLFYLRRDH